jgi:uncharacterized protein YlxP (DUF503 family)
MKILVMKVMISIPYAQSLKDRRNVIKRIKDRVWMKFRASICELNAGEPVTRAILGICYVSNDRVLLDSIGNKITDLIDESFPGMLEDCRHIVEDY